MSDSPMPKGSHVPLLQNHHSSWNLQKGGGITHSVPSFPLEGRDPAPPFMVPPITQQTRSLVSQPQALDISHPLDDGQSYPLGTSQPG